MELSISKIIGILDSNTPFELILEIADTNNIEYNPEELSDSDNRIKLIKLINSIETKKIVKPYSTDDYKYMSKIINPDIEWSTPQLEQAYQHFDKYKDTSNYSYVNKDFKSGKQTPDNIYVLNNYVIYAICKYYKIKLSEETSIDDMIILLREFLSNKENIIKSISEELYEYNDTNLLKLYYKIKNKKV